ncbi:MAG: acyl carrier protein [Oscillospiraceae bacterium]|jgi:acyl carrier protein|nr:acyl carrier protein [Oscillospiraceae bacterium]
MVLEKLIGAISEQFEMDKSKITPETDLLDDIGADSLDLIELITSMEDEFGVSAVDEQVYACRKVGELAKYIEALTK